MTKTDSTTPYPGACGLCAGYWVTHLTEGKPVTIGESTEYMAEVARCRHCGTHWEIPAFSYPRVISRARAKRELPGLDAIERALGIEFPDPPAVQSGL